MMSVISLRKGLRPRPSIAPRPREAVFQTITAFVSRIRTFARSSAWPRRIGPWWLNIAEIELSVAARRCLDHRIETRGELRLEVSRWEGSSNERGVAIRWQFPTADARIQLRRLDPTAPEWQTTPWHRTTVRIRSRAKKHRSDDGDARRTVILPE
jgi:hypothetical protein